ncbi:class I SAM-dependent methyltransferase [Rhodobacteraceae bacterium CCMM004]|nr:class I SAM-dependent methyltransferase [Rhodobacteraceae bacterium CCMM004]
MPAPPSFWDRLAPRYAARPLSDPAAYEDTLARTRARLGAQDRVLEIGCGTGMTAVRLAPGVAEYVALDASAGMLAIARARPGADAVRFVQADLADRSKAPGPVDAILAFSVLHLVDDLAATLAEVHDRLRPGGHLISKTPCLAGQGPVVHAAVAALRLVGWAPPMATLAPADLDRAIAAAGFQIVETHDYPPRARYRFVAARRPPNLASGAASA